MSGPFSPSSWMSVVRLTDIFFEEGERVGIRDGVGWPTQKELRKKRKRMNVFDMYARG